MAEVLSKANSSRQAIAHTWVVNTDRDEQDAAEQQQVVRALLRRPLLLAQPNTGDDQARVAQERTFTLLRRHAQPLKDLFRDQLGYDLVIRADHARLFKRPLRAYTDRPARVRPERTRPGPEDTWTPFTRRHYTMLALLLAALEAAHGCRQILLSSLAQETAAVGAELQLPVAFEDRTERRAFAESVDWLVRWGVLTQRDGTAAHWVGGETSETAQQQEALFDIHHSRLGDIKGTPVPLTDITRADDIIDRDTDFPHGEVEQRTYARHQITRRLVEDPILYRDQLPEQLQHTYRTRRHIIEPQLEQLTGLQAERRAEGSALVDDQRDPLTDIRFPVRSHVCQAALLLCEQLASRRDGSSSVPYTVAQTIMNALHRKHRDVWGRDRSSESLLEAALGLLEAMQLVCMSADRQTVTMLAASARYTDLTIRTT
jgi:uncharacterized protein (TIGR02678 family)